MNIENYKILKLVNSEMIVCEMNNESPQHYEIINPLKMDIENKSNKKLGDLIKELGDKHVNIKSEILFLVEKF